MKLSLTFARDEDGAWVPASPGLPGGVSLGTSKAAVVKTMQAGIAQCLTDMEHGPACPTRTRKNRFASEALIGSLAIGLKTGDNATVRRLARQRLEAVADIRDARAIERAREEPGLM